jgi:hypothetical protein
MMKSSHLLFALFFATPSLASAQAQPGDPADADEAVPVETPPPPPTPAPAPAPAPSAAPAPVQNTPWYSPPKAQATTTPQVDSAPAEPEEPLPPAEPPAWFGSIGVKATYITHTGFDPFATNDALTQGSLELSRRLWKQSSLSVAAGLEFDFGSRTATARGEETKLDTWRLTVGPEVRWNLIPQLFFYVQPSVGVSRSVARMEEGTAGTTLYARSWDIAVDGAGGAAFAFWDLRNRSSDLRFWIVGEGGYAWTDSSELSLSPDEGSGAPERTDPLELGELALRGPYFKVAVAASF